MSELIAVTGATGAVGGRVAQRLAAAGVRQRLVVRDPARAPDIPRSSVAQASYDDGDAMRAALRGAAALLFVSASEHPDRVSLHRSVVEAAKAEGVERIVYTSFLAAAPDTTFTFGRDHFATEVVIRSLGFDYTFLRDSLYQDILPFMAGEDDVIRGPAGDGRFAPVARDDVAEVAATVLLEQGHNGQTYDLTGPELMNMADVAGAISAHLGREISFVNESLDEAYASRAVYNAPSWEVDGWVTSYLAIANGDLAVVSDAVERVTGHPAITLHEHLRAKG